MQDSSDVTVLPYFGTALGQTPFSAGSLLMAVRRLPEASKATCFLIHVQWERFPELNLTGLDHVNMGHVLLY